MKAILPFLLALVIPASSEVMFQFDYTGSTEFDDSSIGAARKQALEAAATSLGKIFNDEATVQIKVTSSNDANSDTLASAGSAPAEVDDSFFGYTPAVVIKKILTGVDDNGSSADGEVDVNFGVNWNLGDNVPINAFDFKSTIIHEILHALGFGSSISQDGLDIFDTPAGDPGVWDVFDKFITDAAGNGVINGGTFALNVSTWQSHSVGGSSPSGGLFFSGPLAKASNGGNPVGIYTPTTWESGSSGSHLDDENLAQYYGLLMLSSTDTGQYRRSVSRVERAILRDLGYDVKPVADPEIQWVSLDSSNAGIMLSGQIDTTHRIQSSSTPGSWINMDSYLLTATQPTMEITIPIPANTPRYFYRALEVPTPPPAALSLQGERKKYRR